MTTATCEVEQQIKYGELTWLLSKSDSLQYKTIIPRVGHARVYQYPETDQDWCGGRWLWSINFDLLPTGFNPVVLKMEASDIVATRDEAMLACLDAKGLFIEDLRQLLMILCPGDEYAQGRRAGQEEIKQRVIDFLQ